MILVRLAPFALLAACALSGPQPTPTAADRLEAECRLLQAAARMMAAQGTPAHDGLSEGCPGVTARDTRPLPRQSASLRAANAAALPAGVPAASRAQAVFRRMITRGVPPAVAGSLVTRAEFTAATR